jgi:hypothetical protein
MAMAAWFTAQVPIALAKAMLVKITRPVASPGGAIIPVRRGWFQNLSAKFTGNVIVIIRIL